MEDIRGTERETQRILKPPPVLCCCLGCTPEVDVLHDNYVHTRRTCVLPLVVCACVCRALLFLYISEIIFQQ